LAHSINFCCMPQSLPFSIFYESVLMQYPYKTHTKPAELQ